VGLHSALANQGVAAEAEARARASAQALAEGRAEAAAEQAFDAATIRALREELVEAEQVMAALAAHIQDATAEAEAGKGRLVSALRSAEVAALGAWELVSAQPDGSLDQSLDQCLGEVTNRGMHQLRRRRAAATTASLGGLESLVASGSVDRAAAASVDFGHEVDLDDDDDDDPERHDVDAPVPFHDAVAAAVGRALAGAHQAAAAAAAGEARLSEATASLALARDDARLRLRSLKRELDRFFVALFAGSLALFAGTLLLHYKAVITAIVAGVLESNQA
jgi:hypothetical protein